MSCASMCGRLNVENQMQKLCTYCGQSGHRAHECPRLVNGANEGLCPARSCQGMLDCCPRVKSASIGWVGRLVDEGTKG